LKFPKITINIPNIITLLRIVFIPLFIYFLSLKTMTGWVLSLVVFSLASFTDMLDGWSARKLKQESEFGKFLDPIADKFLVIASLIALIALDPYLEIFDFWMIIIIVGRDIMITIMRYLAIKRGRPLKTSMFRTIKTAFQMISTVLILMTYIFRKGGYIIADVSVPYWIMLGVTVLTALSGVRYLLTNYNLFFPERTQVKDGIVMK